MIAPNPYNDFSDAFVVTWLYFSQALSMASWNIKKVLYGFFWKCRGNFDGLSTFSLLKWQFRGIHHFQTNSYQQPPDWLPWVLWHSSNMLGGESINLNHNQTSISPLSTDLPWNKDLVMIAFKLPLTRNYWLVVYLPLWKIWVRQLGWWHSQYMEKNNPNVPNHQPAIMTRRPMFSLVQPQSFMVQHDFFSFHVSFCDAAQRYPKCRPYGHNIIMYHRFIKNPLYHSLSWFNLGLILV